MSERKFVDHRLLAGGELGVAPQSQERLKNLPEVIEQVNQKFTGRIQYFRLARMKSLMQEIGPWLRRRLRCLRLKQCKRAHAITRFFNELGRG